MVVSILLLIGLRAATQTQITQTQSTKLDASQIKLTIQVVEWAKCTAKDTAVPPKWDCNGITLYRFRMSDGTIQGPFIAVPAPAGFAIDAKWTEQALP